MYTHIHWWVCVGGWVQWLLPKKIKKLSKRRARESIAACIGCRRRRDREKTIEKRLPKPLPSPHTIVLGRTIYTRDRPALTVTSMYNNSRFAYIPLLLEPLLLLNLAAGCTILFCRTITTVYGPFKNRTSISQVMYILYYIYRCAYCREIFPPRISFGKLLRYRRIIFREWFWTSRIL